MSNGTGLLGCNMFAYCNNNPINYVDVSGNMAVAVIGMGTAIALNWWNPIGWAIAGGLTIIGLIALYEAATVIVTEANKLIVERKTGSTPASPQPPRNNNSSNSSNNHGNNSNQNPQYEGGTLYSKKGIRIDYEYYGNGNGNVHIHIQNGKYYYNSTANQLTYANGRTAPKSIQQYLNDKYILRALQRGAEILRGLAGWK